MVITSYSWNQVSISTKKDQLLNPEWSLFGTKYLPDLAQGHIFCDYKCLMAFTLLQRSNNVKCHPGLPLPIMAKVLCAQVSHRWQIHPTLLEVRGEHKCPMLCAPIIRIGLLSGVSFSRIDMSDISGMGLPRIFPFPDCKRIWKQKCHWAKYNMRRAVAPNVTIPFRHLHIYIWDSAVCHPAWYWSKYWDMASRPALIPIIWSIQL